MKTPFALFSAMLVLPLGAQTLTVGGFSAGSPSLRLEPGQAATRVFTGNFYQPGGTGGQVLGNVNTFTGQPSYTVPLYTLSARGEVAFSFSLTFSGPTFPTVENNNDRAPAGWVGVGWSMQTPFVAINHKGTRSYSDDVIFCNLGPYGGGQLIWQPKTKRFHVATAPGIIVTRDTVSNPGSPLHGQIKAWTFTIPATGVRLVFGDASSDTIVNSHRYLQHAGGMIVASPYNTGSAKPFIHRWDLRRLEDHSGKTGLDFEYNRFQEALWGGRSYTRESYLKKATWRDEFGNEIRRVELGLDTLQAGEYSGYFPGEAKTSQKPYETRYLRSLTVFDEGAQTLKYLLKRNVKNLTYGKKGVLDSITPFHGPGEKRGPGWAFGYRTGDQLLEEIVVPTGTKERFEYQTLNLDATLAGRDGRFPFRDTTGTVLQIPNNADGWRPETSCDDRFCYEIVLKTTGNQKKYVRVAYNTGNYFDTAAIVFQKIIEGSSTSTDEMQVIPMGDYLLIANMELATVELWEWDGIRFQKRNDSVGEADDPIRSHFGYQNGEHTNIAVYPGGPNYFLVYRTEARNPLPRRIWVYLRNPESGKWTNLTRGNRGTSGCKFDNPPKPNGGGTYNPASGWNNDCFNWRDPLMVVANERMFAVRESEENLLYWYALNAAGTGFDSIGQLIPQFPDGVQETSGGYPSPQNWNHGIREMRMGSDYLMVRSMPSAQDESRFDFLFYDGATVKRIGKLDWESDEQRSGANTAIGVLYDRFVLLADSYFIHANTRTAGPKRVEYWRRRQGGDSIYFEKTGPDIRTDIPNEQDADNRIALGSRHFSIEYYPTTAFDVGGYPRKPPLTDGSGNVRSWLYRINDTAGVDEVPAASYSLTWDGCSRKAWNMSFSGLDNVLMATVHKGSGSCGCAGDTTCRIRNISAKLNNLSTSLTLDTITDPSQPSGAPVKMRDRSWSFGARLGLASFISSIPGVQDTVWNRRYFFDGRTYNSSVTAAVVHRFIREAASDSVHPPEVTEFDFTPPHPAFVTEFNHNSLTPQFEYAKVTRKGLPGGTIYSQFVDHQDYKLLLDSAGLSGRVRCVTTVNGAGDTLAIQHTAYADPYSRGWSAPGVEDSTVPGPWPQGVAMNRPWKIENRQWSGNRSYQTFRTYPHAFSDSLEIPLFTVAEQGNRRAVFQSLLDPTGTRVVRSLAYDYPDTANLTETFLRGYRNSVLPLDSAQGKFAVASSQADYDPLFPYKVVRAYGWRDPGVQREDEELQQGPIPSFDPDENLFVASEVTKRDSLGQPLETLVEDGDARKYTSVFYEGRASLPVGVVTGARRDNAAILTAGNAPVPQLLAQGRLDRDLLWEAPGVTYDSAKVRTGRYSFKVTDHYGPSINLHLKDAREDGFGFIASAWIYGDMDAAPLFSISWRCGSDNAIMRVRLAAPVGGAYVRGKWQRWEIRIPHDSLVAGGRFIDGSNDYLRIFVGPGDPASNPARVIYVDDIVFRPDNSVFSTTAYNHRGQPTHVTDTHHRTITREYGLAGQPTVTRDERGRIFSQSGFNKPGEN